MQPKYSVIVPVYNSAPTLNVLVNRIEQVMSPYESYELLLIDDCSDDDSWEVLKDIKKGREHFRLIRLTKNFGQAAVIICGINEAKSNIMITIDDDLQYPPEEIPKLIEAFDPSKHYILCGVPRQKKERKWRRPGSFLVDQFLNKLVFRQKKKLRFSSFRILTKKLHKRENYNERWMRNQQIFFKMVSPRFMDYIYVDHEPRKKGKSNYNLFKKVAIGLNLIMVTTRLPFYLFIIAFILSVLYSIIIVTAFGLLVIMLFLHPIYLKSLGVEPYAIWEEA